MLKRVRHDCNCHTDENRNLVNYHEMPKQVRHDSNCHTDENQNLLNYHKMPSR